MREKIARFMSGRYGSDQLNRLFSVLCLVLLLMAVIFNGTAVSRVLWMLSFALLLLVYFRMFSRNVYKRTQENNNYMRIRYNTVKKFRMIKERWTQRKEYRFFSCPSCHTTLRVPKGKGKINIVCRKCGTSFQGKT